MLVTCVKGVWVAACDSQTGFYQYDYGKYVLRQQGYTYIHTTGI